MTETDLLRRTFRYFARANVAVIAGVIAATATITGAFLVGDSVRASLRTMTLERLGTVEQVLTGPRFISEQTATSLGEDVVPAILLDATLKANDRVAGSVTVVAVPPGMLSRLWPDVASEPGEDEIILNARVVSALEAGVGDSVSVLLELPASVPRDSLLGERDDVLTEVFFDVSAVLPETSGAGRFSLSPAQQLPSVVFIELASLQRALELDAVRATRRTPGRVARVNTVFVPVGAEGDPSAVFEEAVMLDDLDLRLVETPSNGTFSVETRAQILPTAVERAAVEAAQACDAEAAPVLVYLVNELANANDPERFSAYSVVAGVESFEAFSLVGPQPRAVSEKDEIIVNAWLAEDLGVGVGDEMRLTYLEVGDTGDLPEQTVVFRVAGVVAMDGAAVDQTWTPTVPGITDADTFADWDQPYTMDLGRVTDRDEDYWDAHRATPKAWLPLETMRQRFASRYGQATSVRVTGVERGVFADRFLETLQLDEVGLAFRDVRAEQLAAASGTTDFSGLFFGFSFFLIAAALLLIGLLFQLGVEQRTRQLGLLRAVGWSAARVRRQLLVEGLWLAVIGAGVGLVAAVVYAAVMIAGLTSWWNGATGTQFLTLYVTPKALFIGFVTAVCVSIVTMFMAVRRLNRAEPQALLIGRDTLVGEMTSQINGAKIVAVLCTAVAVTLVLTLVAGLLPAGEAFAGFSWRVIGFFVVGMLSLVGGLAWFACVLSPRGEAASWTLSRLGWQNLSRARGRSLLTVSSIAAATFLLVAVGLARKNPAVEMPQMDSGNGGYRLVAESTVPVLTDINTPDGRADADWLGDDGLFGREASVVSLRMRPGDDASCLNLYSARLPTLLGVPDAVLRQWSEEGRFRFADTPAEKPWSLLADDEPSSESEKHTIPVISDMNTLLYSLHSGVGKTIDVPTDVHPNTDLMVVGMLDGSVFQGVLLMSSENLRRLDPSVVGYRYFLVETDDAESVTTALESGLADYGVDAEPVGDRIANFLAVQNTYLTTFQTLGGLGLLLGTLGLGVVMLRNVIERTGELALMRAVGYRPRRLARLILGENALLLTIGLVVGALSAVLAMLPHLTSVSAEVSGPLANLTVLMLVVFIVGMAAAAWAVRQAVRVSVVRAMASE